MSQSLPNQLADISLYGVSGLTSEDAGKRLREFGANELPRTESRRLGRIVLEIIREPMVFLLLGCGVIYFILGDRQEAIMLLGFLGIILGITIYQERKTERALEALRDLSSPRALVIRDGKKQRIAGMELVPGDLLILNEGDRVAADAGLLTCQNLSVDESLLTGESVPVIKAAKHTQTDQATKEGLSSMVYAGTTVVRGSAIAEIVHTGSLTELGKIGKVLQMAVPEQTKLQLETRDLVKRIAIGAAILCLLVFVSYSISRQDWLGGMLTGLTLAMAILPNELPAVLTIFLAAGAWRISQKRVLTRRTPAIEALGTATVLCVDKTGTLTFNRMAVRKIFAQGQIHDLFENPDQKLPEAFHEIVEYGILAGDRDPFDPMERAFKQVGEDHLGQTEHLHPEWTLLKQYPLSPELLALSHVWTTVDGAMHPIAAKGAPEAVIELCHLKPEESAEISAQVKVLAAAGLRVLGVAKSRFPDGPLPEKQHDFDFEFVGLVGLEDRLRPEVPEAIKECHSAGIRVIMITGDHPETARSIARQINLPNADDILTGTELNKLSDTQLQERVRSIQVCARMVPEQKLRLITALKASGEIVAMTGDGVNDAPALKSAHIGIAMGQRGTDVARESASLVLLDDDFGSIVEAIKMGRRIFENLQHAMAYLLAVHIPITGISIIPVFFNLPLVLLPMHIAFLHLIIEPACSIAFEAEPTGQGVMQRPPRRSDERLFSKSFLIPTLWQGLTVLIVLLLVFGISLSRNQGEMEARTLTFATLIVASLGLIVSNRSWTESTLSRGRATNKAFWWVLGGTVVMLAAVLYLPSLRNLFRFSQMHPVDVALILGAGLASGLWFEAMKALRRARGQRLGEVKAHP